MKKPIDLIQLIEDLDAETHDSSVEAESNSYAVIHTEYSTDESGIKLDEKECKLVFNTEDTAEQLFEALGRPAEATIILSNLVLEDTVTAALERNFAAVDEA
jgi:hypothetical protein